MSKLNELPLKTREALPEDLNFIFNSWISSYRRAKHNNNIPAPFYFHGQHKVIERVLRQAKTLLLVDANHTENIYAYMIYEEIEGIFCVHYAYTKNVYRGFGMQRKLLSLVRSNESAGIYTQDSPAARFVADKANLYHNPYIIVEHLKPLPPGTNIEFQVAKSRAGLE